MFFWFRIYYIYYDWIEGLGYIVFFEGIIFIGLSVIVFVL